MVHPAFETRQRTRWLRPDAAKFVRPDAAKFLKPDTDPADVFPALAPRRDARRRADVQAFDDAIAHERSVLESLRADLARIKSDLAWRLSVRALAQKYSDSQPRVPAGSGRESGRWTSDSSGLPRVYIYGADHEDHGIGDSGQFDEIVIDGSDDNPGFDNDSDSSELSNDLESARSDNTTRDSSLADDKPTRIGDSRVVSDADPDRIRVRERYAQLDKITDAAGHPYYAPGGHHEMAKGTYRNWNLQPETRLVFDSSTTGTLPKGSVRFDPDGIPYANRWGGPNSPHVRYNEAVTELSEQFLQKNNLRPENMTPQQAQDLLAQIRESQDPRIRDFNRAMRMLRRVYRFRFGRGE